MLVLAFASFYTSFSNLFVAFAICSNLSFSFCSIVLAVLESSGLFRKFRETLRMNLNQHSSKSDRVTPKSKEHIVFKQVPKKILGSEFVLRKFLGNS